MLQVTLQGLKERKLHCHENFKFDTFEIFSFHLSFLISWKSTQPLNSVTWNFIMSENILPFSLSSCHPVEEPNTKQHSNNFSLTD